MQGKEKAMKIAVLALVIALYGCVIDTSNIEPANPAIEVVPIANTIVSTSETNVEQKYSLSKVEESKTVVVDNLTVQKPVKILSKEESKIDTTVVETKTVEQPKIVKEDFSSLPANAAKNLPILREVAKLKWAEYETPSIFASQAEKESCNSLKHKNCWSGHAELKTFREYGFGLGQITIAYNSDGSVRFNKFEELKSTDEDLKNWKFADRYNTRLQSVALVILNRINYTAIKKFNPATQEEHTAMMLAAYNGGLGGVTNDISLCRRAKGCDPTRWYSNVERHTKKSKTKYKGYGQSVADINRVYPFDIMYTRRTKYINFFDDKIVHKKVVAKPHQF